MWLMTLVTSIFPTEVVFTMISGHEVGHLPYFGPFFSHMGIYSLEEEIPWESTALLLKKKKKATHELDHRSLHVVTCIQ